MFASGWPNPFLKPKVLWERIGVTEGSAQGRNPIFQTIRPDQHIPLLFKLLQFCRRDTAA